MSSFKHRFKRQERMISTAPAPEPVAVEDLHALAARFNAHADKRVRSTGKPAGRVRA